MTLPRPQNRLVRATDVIGLPVVTIAAGDDIAEIRDVVYDSYRHTLIGFTLNKRGWFRGRLKARLRADDIEAIGPNAVMVADEDALVERSEAPAPLADISDAYDVIGTDVLSSGGVRLGEVTEVILSTGEDPHAVGYELAGPDAGTLFIPIDAQLALSDDNLIVPAEAEAYVRNDLAGFGGAVSDYRAALDAAGQDGGADD